MSGKRDDDSQADMEVGMTTAERRRRRRRGGGLRVPSDNVPRRTSPPVVAPVPEDPSLAMSIAYSFTSDSSEPVRAPTGELPAFADPVAPDGMSTVIDPVSGPVEQADFEMKTREMSAVDLEALGLTDTTGSSNPRIPAMPAADITIPDPPAPSSRDSLPGLEIRFKRPDRARRVEARADSTEEVDVEIADVEEPATSRTATRPMPPPAEAVSRGRERLKTVALSDDDLEEVRDVVRALPPMATTSGPMPPLPPLSLTSSSPGFRPPGSTTIPPRAHTPTPPPPVTPKLEVRSAADEMWDEETPAPRAEVAAPPPPAPPAAPLPSVIVAPAPAITTPDARATTDGDDDSADASMAELDIQELAERAETSGEFEVAVDEVEEIKSVGTAAPVSRSQPVPVAAAPPHDDARRARTPSAPPPLAPGAVAQAQSQSASSSGGHAVPHPAHPGKDGHGHHAPPPPPPAALHHHKAPPAPPAPAKKDAKPAPPATSRTQTPPADGRPRAKPWFVDLFDEDYLRTLPFLTPQATQAEAEFVADAMQLTPGAQVLDVGCGYGRHAMELAARGFHIVGLDLSTPLLIRGGEEAQRRGLQINFVRGDMRELDFDAQFDGVYCLFSTFGYFDDETNKRTVANIARALKPGGRVLIEILNRDYVIADLPTRVWWEGDGCVVLEEVELNYFSSRIQVNRSVVFDDGRQLEQEISVRAYSLHEVGKLMHAAGFRVLEVSGGYQTRGRFFGNQSRHIIVLAERKDPAAP